MGGNALKCSTRLPQEQYFKLVDKLFDDILFPINFQKYGMNIDTKVLSGTPIVTNKNVFYLVPSYANKVDYGDCDIVVNSNNYQPIFNALKIALHTDNWIQNTNVLSIEYNNFQIDFIAQSPKHSDISLKYYSFSDASNLYGRIAHAMGFKFGHDGLWYMYRDGDYLIKELLVTDNYYQALQFVGLDPQRYKDFFGSNENSVGGFEELNDIFEYVASSNYFNKELYPLEHRSNTARVRDKKRATYQAFLNWCDNYTGPNYEFLDRDSYLKQAKQQFPDFKQEYELQVPVLSTI